MEIKQLMDDTDHYSDNDDKKECFFCVITSTPIIVFLFNERPLNALSSLLMVKSYIVKAAWINYSSKSWRGYIYRGLTQFFSLFAYTRAKMNWEIFVG